MAAGKQGIRNWVAGSMGYVQINRPNKANSYTPAMLEALDRSLDMMKRDETIKTLVLCAVGKKSFCAGADLEEMRKCDYRNALDLKSADIFKRLSNFPKVTLASINGAVIGGGLELALSCDLRIASENARFSMPETALGLIPAAGGTKRLPRIVGISRAKELILGGRAWNAQQALNYGLVNDVVSSDQLMPVVQRLGENIARRDALALRLAKKAIDRNFFTGPENDFELVVQALLYQLKWERSQLMEEGSP